MQERKRGALCEELERNRRLGPSAGGWARCLLTKPHPGAERLALTYATEGRTSLPAARASHDKALAPVPDRVVKAIKDPNLF